MNRSASPRAEPLETLIEHGKRGPSSLALWWAEGSLATDLFAILFLAVVVIFPALGQTHYLAPREIRHCEIAREIAVSHDYIVPRLLGEVYPDKPPVMHALAAKFMQWWGQPTIFLGRLPSALAGVGVLLMTYALGRVLGDRKLGLIGALGLLAMPGFVIMSRQARPDMILGFAILACSLAFALGMRSSHRGARTGWFALAGLASGLGVVTKGPYGLLFPLFFVFFGALRRPEWKRPRAGWIAFVLGLSAAVSVWAWPAYLRDGGKFLAQVITQRDLDVTQHASSWYLLLAPTIFLTLPISLFLPLAIRDFWRGLYNAPLACAGAMYALIQAIPKKRAHYFVPLYPFLSLGLAQTILRHVTESLRLRRVALVTGVAGAAIVPFYFAVIAPLFEWREEPDLQIAAQILAKAGSTAPIYAPIALAEPLAWMGKEHTRLHVLEADATPLNELEQAAPGAVMVVLMEQRQLFTNMAKDRAIEELGVFEWRRHKLDAVLNFRKRPLREVVVFRIGERLTALTAAVPSVK